MQEIKEKDIEKFVKLARELDKLMKEIRKYKFEANLYVAEGSINLMSDMHHDFYSTDAIQENIVSSISVDSIDSGAW